MKVIITGSGGLLGTELLNQLKNYEEVEVYALTSKYSSLVTKYKNNRNIRICNSSITAVNKMELTKEDILINCAFPRDIQADMASGLKYIKEILEVVVYKGIGKVINISSQSVYSQNRVCPAKEGDTVKLESMYSVGKYATELLTESICKNINYTNIRLASLIGVQFEQRITNKLVKQVIQHNDLRIIGGQQIFSFLDVRDAASALIKMVQLPTNNWKKIYNLGTNEAYTLSELTEIIISIGKKSFCLNARMEVEKKDNWQNFQLDSSIFYRQFNWLPCYKIQDTVKEIYLKYLENRG